MQPAVIRHRGRWPTDRDLRGVRNAEMKCLDIRGDAFHPEWNYSVIPRRPKS
jgi:hypothetical protein